MYGEQRAFGELIHYFHHVHPEGRTWIYLLKNLIYFFIFSFRKICILCLVIHFCLRILTKLSVNSTDHIGEFSLIIS